MQFQVVHLIENEPVLAELQQLRQLPGAKLDPYYFLIDWRFPAAYEKFFENDAVDVGFGFGVDVDVDVAGGAVGVVGDVEVIAADFVDEVAGVAGS